MKREDKTTIALHKDTVQRLGEFGRFNESYEDVVNRLLDRISEFENVGGS